MQTKLDEISLTRPTVPSASAVTADGLLEDNFLRHLAPVSIGAFFFGSFHPNNEDKVQAQRALYKTSFLFRHFLQAGGLKVVIDDGCLTLSGKTSSSAVSLMAYVLGMQIMGPNIRVVDETTRVDEHGRPGKSSDQQVENELRARLQLMLATDAMLGSEEIEVSVGNGQGKVSGQVSSAEHKIWAETLLHAICPHCKISIQVSARAAERNKAAKARPPIDDDSLQALAVTRLKLLPNLTRLDAKVSSLRQSVLLSGSVGVAADRDLAEQVVRHTFGLKDFKGGLSVKS